MPLSVASSPVLSPSASMSQLAPLDPAMDAPQDEAWSCLLQLKAQVQITQTSLFHHTSELSALHQTTDTISNSLWALLERLPVASAAPPPSPTPTPRFPAMRMAPPALGRANIPRPALPDVYDGDRASGERFLQSCATYIQLCGNDFLSNELKIVWVLSYMKFGRAATYAMRVFRRPGGVAGFVTTHLRDTPHTPGTPRLTPTLPPDFPARCPAFTRCASPALLTLTSGNHRINPS
ncbi:hypothetical protein C0992_011179 [Termitomyces sp. T32_za158]|nr:hypothetical protein C0992_011179 [Termitomyces sp. T32_za158]